MWLKLFKLSYILKLLYTKSILHQLLSPKTSKLFPKNYSKFSNSPLPHYHSIQAQPFVIQRNISSVRQGISGAIKLETMFAPGCNAFPSVSPSTMPRVSPRTTNEPPHSSFIRFAFASLLVGLVMRCYSKIFVHHLIWLILDRIARFHPRITGWWRWYVNFFSWNA